MYLLIKSMMQMYKKKKKEKVGERKPIFLEANIIRCSVDVDTRAVIAGKKFATM